jgi:hypothetical protein
MPTKAELETYMFNRVNDIRTQNGLTPYRPDAELFKAADAHSADMLAHDYFSHTSPNGESPGDRLHDAGYSWSGNSEIIAYSSDNGVMEYSDMDQLLNLWMNSPDHRAAILSTTNTEAGFGIEYGEYNGHMIVMGTGDFGRPTAAEAAENDKFLPTNTSTTSTTGSGSSSGGSQTPSSPSSSPTDPWGFGSIGNQWFGSIPHYWIPSAPIDYWTPG